MSHLWDRARARCDAKAIDAILGELDQCSLPGAAVGIAVGGVPVYRRGFGLASVELPVTLTPHTRMRIYSTTKHFTCLAYLLFCEEGRAGLDDPVGKYLPELHPVTHRVTMRQLMSNTSGLRDACEIRWTFSGVERVVPARELLELYRSIEDVNFAPGEGYRYNNGGFHILSAAIEKLAGEPLEEVLRKRIFTPVGMHDTLLRRVDTDFLPNAATMHMIGPNGGYQRRYLAGELVGEGGIVSTVDDMLRWLEHRAHPRVGKPETWALMTSSHRLNDGAETGYGLGLFRCPYRGLDTISHGGGGLGSNSQMICVPEADLDVIAMVNRHDVSAAELAGKVLDACLGFSSAVPVEGGYVSGLFRSPTTGSVIQLYVKDGAQMALIDGGECPMVLIEENVLQAKLWPSWNLALRWQGDAERPDSIRYEFFGRSDELQPLSACEMPGVDSIAGEYIAETIGVRLRIDGSGEDARMTSTGSFGSNAFRLEGIGSGLWKFKAIDTTGWGGIVAGLAGHGRISVGTWGLRQLPFRRIS